MSKDKVLLVFPDGVGIRNYLYSEVFADVDELVLYHNFTKDTIQYLNSIQHLHAVHEIPEYREGVKEKFLRELISLSRLHHNANLTDNPTILRNWNANHSGILKKLFYKSVAFAAHFVRTYDHILALEKRYQHAIRQNAFYDDVSAFLAREKPTSVFCSHQRGLKMATIFAAAADMGIPTTTVIYSWDNLPKARLALKSDVYAVWSPFMKDELQLYYPEIDQRKVVVTGTPQFNFYRNPNNVMAKDDFYKRYQLDPKKKIICYSGDDIKTSPDDPKYLEDVATAIVSNGLADEYQILFRRCPVDFSGRYDTVVARYPGLIREAPPAWTSNTKDRWYDAFPLYDDIALLVSTCYYSDVVINLGSTMAFDFAMYGKPCLYINYDQQIKADAQWSVHEVYKFQHFRSMESLKAVGWINSPDDIVPLITKSVHSPFEVGPERAQWMHKVVGEPSGNFSLFANIHKKP